MFDMILERAGLREEGIVKLWLLRMYRTYVASFSRQGCHMRHSAVMLSSLHNSRACRLDLVRHICMGVHSWHLLNGHKFRDGEKHVTASMDP